MIVFMLAMEALDVILEIGLNRYNIFKCISFVVMFVYIWQEFLHVVVLQQILGSKILRDE